MNNESKISNSGPEAGPTLEFCLRLSRAYASLTRRMDYALGSFHGLSFSDFMLLYSLGRSPGLRLRRIELADRQGLSASGITRALIPLEKIGLVTREADARDARVGYAVLTAAGLNLLENTLDSAELVSREVLGATPVRELRALSALLGRIAGTGTGDG